MKRISAFSNNNGALLVIWQTPNGNLVGEVFSNGIPERGAWDSRATFYRKDNEATEYRVKEYFGFTNAEMVWHRDWDYLVKKKYNYFNVQSPTKCENFNDYWDAVRFYCKCEKSTYLRGVKEYAGGDDYRTIIDKQ